MVALGWLLVLIGFAAGTNKDEKNEDDYYYAEDYDYM